MPVSRQKNDDVERVCEACDIVRIVGEHVALKPKGREYVGLCPFHDDHRPSMNVIPSKQIFHCFVCGAGGTVLGFVRKFHRMEFREALEYLAEKSNIKLTPWRGAPAEQDAQAGEATRADLVGACSAAAGYFRAIYTHPDHGKAARDVVARRGISAEMVEHFGIGASADRWDGLLKTLESKGLTADVFAQAGLLKRRESDGGWYDAFRNRLMFPIQDQIGRVIAFGARKIAEADEPKYLNSPETRLFQKSSTLYGLHQAARAIQSKRVVVVTEGYTDVIACHQAGITNVVATLGTALTPGHATVLRRLCDTVVLLFDGDDAGRRAADRAVDVFFAEDLDVKIATLATVTDAKDPDELLKRPDGKGLLERAFAGARDLLDYRYARMREGLAGAGASELSRTVEEDLKRLVDLGLMHVRPVRRQLILKRLTEITGVNAEAIIASRPAGRRGPELGARSASRSEGEASDGARSTMAPAEHLLGCVLCDGTLWQSLAGEKRDLIGPGVYRSELVASVAHAAALVAGSGGTPDLASVLLVIEDLGVQEAAVALASRIEAATEGNPDRLRSHWSECLALCERDAAARAHAEDAGNGLSFHEQIEMKRRLHANLGADRRVLPRPR